MKGTIIFIFFAFPSVNAMTQDTITTSSIYFELGSAKLDKKRLFELDSIHNFILKRHHPDSVKIIYRNKALRVSSKILTHVRADSIASYLNNKQSYLKYIPTGKVDWYDSFEGLHPSEFMPEISFVIYKTNYEFELFVDVQPIERECPDTIFLKLFEEDSLILITEIESGNNPIQLNSDLIKKNRNYTLVAFSKKGSYFPAEDSFSTIGKNKNTRFVRSLQLTEAKVSFKPFPEIQYQKKEIQPDSLVLSELQIVVAFMEFYCQNTIAINYFMKSSKPSKLDIKRIEFLKSYFINHHLEERISLVTVKNKKSAGSAVFKLDGVVG